MPLCVFAPPKRRRVELGQKIKSIRDLGYRVLRRLNSALYRLAQINWSTHKLYYKCSLALNSTPSPLIVYSMGKVGSSTVIRSIVKSNCNIRPYQVHWLTRENMRFDEAFYYRQEVRFRNTPVARRFRPTYIWNAEYLLNRIKKKRRSKSKYKVVSLTRDPVARNLSSFFQNLELFFGYDIKKKAQCKDKIPVLAELQRLFQQNYVENSEVLRADSNPLTWFTVELGDAFNLDVYKEPFDRVDGYQLYDTPDARILVIKLEKLRDCAEFALGEFLGVSDFRLATANVASSKPYASIYKEFVSSVQLPGRYLDKLYDSQYSKHFYTDEEIHEFREYWSGNSRGQ